MASGYAELFGAPRTRAGAEWYDFLPDKRFQLLAFLADAGTWVGRDKLCYLFWPDVPTDRAHNSLRQTFKRIKALAIPGAVLEAERYRVRWSVESDVALFSRALADGDHEAAVALYRGPFLRDLDSPDCSEFQHWLEFRRQHLFGQWREALNYRVEELRSLGRFREAAQLLTRLLEQDPLDEHSLQEFMRVCIQHGAAGPGIQAYEEFARRIRTELELAPSSSTAALARELQTVLLSSEDRQSRSLQKASVSPPRVGTSFLGRKKELRALGELLRRDDCRLVSLIGPGGVGKSRIAMEAMTELGSQFADGVYYVPLDALSSHQAIPASIANALAMPLAPRGEPLTQLIQGIGKARLLLVLDNFEHLPEGGVMLSTLLGKCPGVKLLVTSRARLYLVEEWVLDVEGLPFPGANDRDVGEYDSVRLFFERAAQIAPEYRDEDDDVASVCRLVHGYPLGIELAATWARLMPARAIAREIEANLDFLESDLLDLPERQRSIRAAFEHSWRLLAASERRALARLAVFRGGFTRDAASLVAGCPLAVLAALVDKSLLSVDSTGRFDFHPLLRRFALDTLGPRELESAREEHGRYFLRMLRTLESAPPNETETSLRELQEEVGNVSEAWRWAVATGAVNEIRGCAKPLVNLLQQRLSDAIELLRSALEVVTTLEEGVERDERELELQIALGPALMATSGFASPDVVQAYGKAWELSGELAESPARFPVLWGQWVYYTTGADNVRGKELGDRLLRLAHRSRDEEMLLEAHHALWTTYVALGSFVQARHHIDTGLDLYDPARHHHLATSYGGHDAGVCSLAFAGPVLWSLGFPDLALSRSRRSLSLARELRHPMSQIMASYWLAMLHQLRQEPNESLDCATATLALAQEHGNAMFSAWSQCLRGWALSRLGDPDEGIEEIRRGLSAYRATGGGMYQTHVLAMLAEANLTAGRLVEAQATLEEAFRACDQTGEGHHLAELHRLEGELLVETKQFSQAESSFRRSLGVARRQQARSWELRTASSLTRLGSLQGQDGSGLIGLKATYDWFREGLTTPDLLAARELLDRVE